jgi:hypothetical protein
VNVALSLALHGLLDSAALRSILLSGFPAPRNRQTLFTNAANPSQFLELLRAPGRTPGAFRGTTRDPFYSIELQDPTTRLKPAPANHNQPG